MHNKTQSKAVSVSNVARWENELLSCIKLKLTWAVV